MTEEVQYYRFRLKRDQASEFTAKDTLLKEGELAWEINTGFFKIGDGATPWAGRPYLTSDNWKEGTNNLFYTAARARGDVIAAAITDGDTTHAPSGDVVHDALALKAPLYRPQFTDWVGVGTPADRPFVLSSDSNALPAGAASFLIQGSQNKERIECRSASGDPSIQGKKSGGSIAAPSATLFGHALLIVGGSGYDGADWVLGNKGQYRVMASENWTTTAQGAELRLMTTGNGSVGTTVRWRVSHDGHWVPFADNTYDIADGSTRTREIFAANATINTSDAREKSAPRDLTDAELAAAADIARLPSIFQWLHAIEGKGDNARLHCSPTVQAIMRAMKKHGLDPFRYAFVCYDEWDERTEPAEYQTVEVKPAVIRDHPAIYERVQVYTEDGQPERLAERLVSPAWTEVVEPAVTEQRLVREAVTHPAGNRYSLRPAELAWFVLRGQEARLSALEG